MQCCCDFELLLRHLIEIWSKLTHSLMHYYLLLVLDWKMGLLGDITCILAFAPFRCCLGIWCDQATSLHCLYSLRLALATVSQLPFLFAGHMIFMASPCISSSIFQNWMCAEHSHYKSHKCVGVHTLYQEFMWDCTFLPRIFTQPEKLWYLVLVKVFD